MARSPQVGLHQQPNTPTSTSTNNTFKANQQLNQALGIVATGLVMTAIFFYRQ